ncbi:MAG: ATP phosphoribosyltransferase [Anaerolineae bacterium]|nr:ATP phosphoribosyltransferase [Anaerolineae bacterium]
MADNLIRIGNDAEDTRLDRKDIRVSLPSKGRIGTESTSFLAECGLTVRQVNPRQYTAKIPALPGVTVILQRPGDIVVSVRDGSVDFGITGLDMVSERQTDGDGILILHDDLRFSRCQLCAAVPEAWEHVRTTADLTAHARSLPQPLRVATKFPNMTERYLKALDLPFVLIESEGTLEVAPAIGYADMITDLVSSGQTLRDNRLRRLDDGVILQSQAVLIANRPALQSRPELLAVACKLLESIEAHLRAVDRVAIYANVRGSSPEAIGQKLFEQKTLGGLQGPTISQVLARDGNPSWYAVHIIVRREEIYDAVAELRAIGGSGVVVTPVTYIFEEEPERIRAMMEAVGER